MRLVVSWDSGVSGDPSDANDNVSLEEGAAQGFDLSSDTASRLAVGAFLYSILAIRVHSNLAITAGAGEEQVFCDMSYCSQDGLKFSSLDGVWCGKLVSVGGRVVCNMPSH